MSYVLWSVLAAGCGSDDKVGHLPDAPGAVPMLELDGPALAITCGMQPTPIDHEVKNTGTADLVITSVTATGGFEVLTTFPMRIAPGAMAAVRIRPPFAVIGTDRGGTDKMGTLTIVSNASVEPLVQAISATVRGANLVFTDEAGQPVPRPFAFSATGGSCPEPAVVFLSNTGNEPITVGAASASGFAFGGFSGGTIEAGAAVSQDITVVTTGQCSLEENIVYQVTGTVCTLPTVTLPASFALGSGACTCPIPL